MIMIYGHYNFFNKQLKSNSLKFKKLSSLNNGVFFRVEFENRDEAKNIINMRSVIKTVLFTSFFVVSIVVLRFFADQSIFPYGLMMGVLVFTMYLVKFSQNPKIKEYFFHKLTQKKTILQENYYTILSSRILNLRANKVGVLN